MKNNDTFSDDEVPSTAFSERDVNSNDRVLSSPQNVPKDTSSSVHHPGKVPRFTSRHSMRLLLGVMVVVVFIALAGGYGIFRAVSLPSHQASSAFQVTHCPFALGAALIEGQNIRCGFLSVPEDWSQPQGPTIRLAVAIFKTFSSQPALDPVLSLGGGPARHGCRQWDLRTMQETLPRIETLS